MPCSKEVKEEKKGDASTFTTFLLCLVLGDAHRLARRCTGGSARASAVVAQLLAAREMN